MDKLKAIIAVGCSASGKSSWAIKFREDANTNGIDWTIIERDNFRRKILDIKNIVYFNMWEKWNWKWETLVNARVDEMIAISVENNSNIIISDTNLHFGRRMELKRKLEGLGFDVLIEVFGLDLSLDELWERDNCRRHSVSHSVIAKQYAQFRSEFPKYTLKDVSDKPECVICDLDGTLFTMNGRSPFEWMRVDEDDVNEVLVHCLYGLYAKGYEIIFMSGRDEVCRELSTIAIQSAFMSHYHSFNFELHMRVAGDMRKDTIVKEELFFKYVDGNYKVVAVFDDRPIVCNFWREMYLTVYQCGNPYINF